MSPRKPTPAPTLPPGQSRKNLAFIGGSLHDLKAMPKEVQKEAGDELLNVQWGGDPTVPVKPMPDVGPGTLELIVNDKDG